MIKDKRITYIASWYTKRIGQSEPITPMVKRQLVRIITSNKRMLCE